MFISKAAGAGLAVVALLIAPNFAVADDRAAVREMMEVSGMVEQFDNLGAMWREVVLDSTEADPWLAPDLVATVADLSEKALDGKRFLEDLEVALADTLTHAEIATVTDFYKTPLGEVMGEAETASMEQDAMDEVSANVTSLRAQLDEMPDRLLLFQKIEKAQFTSEIAITIVVRLFESVASVILIDERQYTDQEARGIVREHLSSMRPVLLAEMHDFALADYAHTYRDMTQAQLEEYTEFLLSDAALATNAAVLSAATDIFEARGREIGAGLAEYLKQKKA